MYNILDYGAVGDGVTNDGPAIQAAVDACSRAGGGHLLNGPGPETGGEGRKDQKCPLPEYHLRGRERHLYTGKSG